MALDKKDKLDFITSLIDSIKADLVSKIEKMPESWDGHELRILIAEEFAHECSSVLTIKRGGVTPVHRVRAYLRDRFNHQI